MELKREKQAVIGFPCCGRAGNFHSWVQLGCWDRKDGVGGFQGCLIQACDCKKGLGLGLGLGGRHSIGQLSNVRQAMLELGLRTELGTQLLLEVPKTPMPRHAPPCPAHASLAACSPSSKGWPCSLFSG